MESDCDFKKVEMIGVLHSTSESRSGRRTTIGASEQTTFPVTLTTRVSLHFSSRLTSRKKKKNNDQMVERMGYYTRINASKWIKEIYQGFSSHSTHST